MPLFVIHDDEYESGYLEGVQENLMITSQSGFLPIEVMSEAVSGDFEKETIFTGRVKFNDRDPTGTAARETTRFNLDENIGVKVSYNTDKQEIPLADLDRSNFDRLAYSNAMGRSVASEEMKHILNLSIKAAVAAMTAAGGALAIDQIDPFNKKDLTAALRPLEDQGSNIAGWLASRQLGYDILDEAIDANRYSESGSVYRPNPGTLDIPMMTSALEGLRDGTKEIMLALFPGAIQIKLNSNAPRTVIRENDDTENHYQTWSLDGAFNLKLRNMAFIGAGGNVNAAVLTAGANWKKNGSDTNLMGTITRFGA